MRASDGIYDHIPEDIKLLNFTHYPRGKPDLLSLTSCCHPQT